MLARKAFLVCLPAAVLIVSCTSPAPQKAKEPEKPPEPVGAQYAFHQTYLSARTWAQDLEILRVRSLPLAAVKSLPGKSPAWEVTFVSPSKARARTYTYSVIEAEGNLHKGVFSGLEENWTGKRGQNTAFVVPAFKIDSVKAWEVAAEQSKPYMAKNPDTTITFWLEKTPRHPNPTWRVVWGMSPASSNYSIYVDATTGAFLERMR
jgi:hypothetical protein